MAGRVGDNERKPRLLAGGAEDDERKPRLLAILG